MLWRVENNEYKKSYNHINVMTCLTLQVSKKIILKLRAYSNSFKISGKRKMVHLSLLTMSCFVAINEYIVLQDSSASILL